MHVNKTICTTVDEADEVVELAPANDLVPSPGEMLRPQISAVRDAIRSGAIGEVAWAICGCSFEDYHEAEEPERQAGGAQSIRLGTSRRRRWAPL